MIHIVRVFVTLLLVHINVWTLKLVYVIAGGYSATHYWRGLIDLYTPTLALGVHDKFDERQMAILTIASDNKGGRGMHAAAALLAARTGIGGIKQRGSALGRCPQAPFYGTQLARSTAPRHCTMAFNAQIAPGVWRTYTSTVVSRPPKKLKLSCLL